MSTVERVAERALPGGAIAAIDVVTTRAAWRRRRFQGALIVERGERGGRGRETGHRAPIVATARGASIRAVMRKLVPMLRNDSVIAWALSRGAR